MLCSRASYPFPEEPVDRETEGLIRATVPFWQRAYCKSRPAALHLFILRRQLLCHFQLGFGDGGNWSVILAIIQAAVQPEPQAITSGFRRLPGIYFLGK